jgi:uncharacterized membrane protein
MDSLLFHPKVVHLPIALALLIPLVSAGLLFAWFRELLPRRSWIVAVALQALLVGSAFVAMRSGETEEERIESVVAEAYIEAHEEAAEAFTWAASAALLLFAAGFAVPSDRYARQAALAALTASLVVVGLGFRVGDAGGELVYKHGAAAAYTTSATEGAGSSFHDEDD